LRAGLLELKSQPVWSPRVLAGLRDTLDKIPSAVTGPLRVKLQSAPPSHLPDAWALLQELSREIAVLPVDGDTEQQEWTRALVRQCDAARDDLQALVSDPRPFDRVPTLQELAGAATGGERAVERIRLIDQLAQRCAEQAVMDFAFLYDPARDLLSIGYNVSDRRRDPSYYDLLASEARLASFILIAQDQLPQDHWFALGRQLTTHDGAMALLSWSGSMFEYLMPLLVMPTYEHTLLDQTYRAVVARQIEYGRQRGVPWGISESCYNTHRRPRHLSVWRVRRAGIGVQARSRRRSGRRAVRVDAGVDGRAREACQNLETLAADGYHGAYGLYEAIDFTPARVPRGKTSVPLRSYMAHHQGMSLLALTYLLLRPAHAAPVPVRPVLQGVGVALAGAHSQGRFPVAAARGGSQRRAPAAGGGRPLHHARVPVAAHPDSRGAPVVQWPLSRHGHQRGRRVQPVERPGGHALARGRDVRRVGHVLLSARRRHGRALVVGLSTDAAVVEEIRGDLRAGPRRISPPRRGHRRAHGNRRVAGRRRRSPPRHADESLLPRPAPSS
jgi:cyclic beta-1,2-glucan synthetase